MIKFIKHFKKGFSLIEIILSITVSIIVIVAAFMIYQKVDENYRINTAVKQLVTLKTVIQSAYAGQTGYTGLKAENIFHSVPEDLMGDKNILSLQNIYGFKVGISASWMTPSKASNSGFFISYYVKKEDCFRILKRLIPGFSYININTVLVVDNLLNKIEDDAFMYTACLRQTGNKFAEIQVYSY